MTIYEGFPNATSWADIERQVLAEYAAQQTVVANTPLQDRRPPSPQIQAQVGVLTESQIYAKYNSGGYGVVGSAAARNAALADLAQYFKGTGMTAEQAAARAGRAFDANVGAGGALDTLIGGAGGGGGAGVGGGASSGFVTDIPGGTPNTGGTPWAGAGEVSRREQRRMLPLGNLFSAYLNEQAPLGRGAGPFRGYLAGQEESLSDLYRLGQAAGDIPDVTSFKDYLGNRGGISRPSVGQFADYARRGAGALTSGVSMEDNPFREYLSGSEKGTEAETAASYAAAQKRQFDLGLAGSYPNLAREFRGLAGRGAEKAFEQFRYDNPASDFLPWLVNRGFNFF